jgi:hypothetical protein
LVVYLIVFEATILTYVMAMVAVTMEVDEKKAENETAPS